MTISGELMVYLYKSAHHILPTCLLQSISATLQTYRFHMRDSSEDFEGSCFVMASYEDLHRSKIWTFTLFFCAISKERRYMKGYLKERMTYKRILEKKRHLLTDNCELCDKTWGAPVTGQDELWCVNLVLRFFIQSFIANTCLEQWRYLARPSSNSKLLFQLFLGRLKYG